MPTILDFQIQPESAESYSLAVCERGSSRPLATATFSHRVDFLTDFSVDRLNASTKDAAERFDELQKLGRELYQKLFPPAVEQVWQAYKQHSEFLILCLRFAEGATKLEVLPWETLHDGAEFIAAGAKTTLTRLPLDVAPPDELPPIPRPLKLFGFFASPLDLQDHERLNIEREQEILLEAINDPAGQGRISADFEDEAKLEILERNLRDGYQILHFSGHSVSPRDGGGLLLEDAHGKKLPTSIAEVLQALKSGVGKLRLMVFSASYTVNTLHSEGFSDLARELLRQRVPAVIAMQFSISDEGGMKFAEVLYREIAKGVALERAVHTARRVLLADQRFFINNDALAIVLLAADGACLQTIEAESSAPQAEASANYLGDRLDPLAHGFYGRRREYRKVRDALLHQDQRAVIIHGIGGIGKTALLTHAINRLRPRFKDVISFDCRRTALAPETILLELHRYFATQGMPQLQSLIGQNVPPETLAEEMAKLLTKWPLLIVFDNFESQLDERREITSVDLRVFLMTVVRATATGSRFLFTTRYLFDLDGEQFDNLQELPLGDLSRPEALMLMQKLPNLARAAYLEKLAVLEKFGGHPYALVILDRYCSNQSLGQALRDTSSLKPELREFLATKRTVKIKCNGPNRHVNEIHIGNVLQTTTVARGNDPADILSEIPERLSLACSYCPEGRIILTRKMIEEIRLGHYIGLDDGGRPLNEAKLILIGRGGAGKTSLVNRLVHDYFDKAEKKTEGINITKWEFRLNGWEDVRLNIWDFGGQEIMHATHQFFLTRRSIYLLAINGREGGEDANVEYWLKFIESFGDESPIIVVLNKIKEQSFDLNRRALRQKYPYIREFITTDCEDSTGIIELRKVIERETDQLEHLRDSIPTTWFNIRNHLAEMEKSYLSFDEYRGCCQQHGEIDKKEQENLAGYLHDLGIVLNFMDNPRLQDTHVLNPRWITNGIYKILNSETLEKKRGEIHLNDLSGILDDTEYPTKMFPFLLDLMKKFDLCFSLPDDEGRYLIPELLDKQEPEATATFIPQDCLNFQYHYAILPEGLLPRFIVRTHTQSKALSRWRTGVILKFKDCFALVKADMQDRKVFIRVSGNSPDHCRDLLAIIRFHFEEIHRNIPQLPPKEMVPLPGYPGVVVPYHELRVRKSKGKTKFSHVVEEEIIECDALKLLNGVDLEETSLIEKKNEPQIQPMRLFFSYAHKDEWLLNELKPHLTLMQRKGLIAPWHDRQIRAGDYWAEEIDENLESADIILLLISAAFIDSNYCYEKEMKRALERHQNMEARVIPIIVRHVDWQDADFAELQSLPKDGKPVTDWSDRDLAWRDVAEGIKKIVREMGKLG